MFNFATVCSVWIHKAISVMSQCSLTLWSIQLKAVPLSEVSANHRDTKETEGGTEIMRAVAALLVL